MVKLSESAEMQKSAREFSHGFDLSRVSGPGRGGAGLTIIQISIGNDLVRSPPTMGMHNSRTSEEYFHAVFLLSWFGLFFKGQNSFILSF